MTTVSDKQLADTVRLLEILRLELEPAFYGFGAEVVQGKATGRIHEKRFVLQTKQRQDDFGVVFGFWPAGFARGGGEGMVDSVSMPPPIREAMQLSLAPERFLYDLALHLRNKLNLLQRNREETGTGSSPGLADGAETSSDTLMAQTVMALEIYRSTLSPALYCFGPELLDGQPTERIVEERVPFPNQTLEKEHGTVFGFWPEGFACRGEGTPGQVGRVSLPPPIDEVFRLDQAPQDFLLRLLTHVNGKLALLKQQVQPPEAVECASPAHQELTSKAQMALEVYRRMVPPGVYRFYADMSQGEYTGGIIEERTDFDSRSKEREFGPVFGFWPWGYPAEQFAGNLVVRSVCDLPQIRCTNDLIKAPDRYLSALVRHLNRKSGLDA